MLSLRAVKLNSNNTYVIICKCSCIHTSQDVCVAVIQIVTDKQKKNTKYGSYILYLLLLTICYSTFGFSLDIKLSTLYLTFTLLSLTSYVLYLLLLTVRKFAFGFTLDIKIRKNYTKLGVVLSWLQISSFPSLSQFFLLLLDRNLLSGYSPPIMHSPCSS